MSLTTLKWAAILCFIVAMVILLGGGVAMRKDLPPYPGKVVGPDGNLLFEKADILAGQDVYQRYGLMDQGAVWGHGSQRGPEFSAASLHIMTEAIGDYLAQKDYRKPYNDLDDLQKGIIDVKTKHEIKPNRYDAAKDTLMLSAAQIEGLNKIIQHWEKIFKKGPCLRIGSRSQLFQIIKVPNSINIKYLKAIFTITGLAGLDNIKRKTNDS